MLPTDLLPVATQIATLIGNSQKILVAAHLRPDGDATGSVSGMVKSLLKAGKNVDAALLDGVPERFAFVFPQIELIRQPVIDSDHDLILILDSGDESRTGFTFNRDREKTCLVNIDHHASNTMFGDINYVDTGASSACEMVAALLHHAELPFDSEVALSLMLGLVTDSRSFQNEGLRHTAHLAAAKILQTGVDTSPILNMLNSGKAEADLRVQGFGLSNFRLSCNNHLASLVIRHSDLARLNAAFGNVFGSGLFNQLLSMSDTYASVVIFEREDGMSFCEFRSRGGIDVKEVAVAMGGGGHVPASGCSRAVKIDELAEEAIKLMTRQVDTFFAGQKNA
ncbi:MAG: hypothetical protein CVV41_05450 [Candidatus Riflebacteria bacterium HGW-Riflebacteria-1]|jgi:phosphoesterase RecJ-like protein|nr:MAG: hypothetical protein CVV41_05450 [Candidatus Riflebacteria bacterium HGW-Riflebacteria-1]